MRAKRSLVLHTAPRTAAVAFAAALVVAIALPARGAEWAAFRNGPQRLNYTPEPFTPPFTLVWKFTTEPSTKRVPPVVTTDRVFVVAGSNAYCLDLTTGSPIWRYDAQSPILAAPTYADGKVFLGAEDGAIIALNAKDGTEAWTLETPRSVRGAPAVVEGTVYADSLDWHLRAIDEATGAQRWARRLSDELWGAPAFRNGLVYVPTLDAQVFALEAKGGRTRVQVTFPVRRAIQHCAVVTDDAIYVAGRSDMYALTLRGVQRWAAEFDAFPTGAPAVADNRVYLALINGRLLAMDALKGTTLWRFEFNSRMSAPPTVVDDVVIAGARGGTVYALDARTGAPRWRYWARPPGLAAGSSAAFDLVASPVYSNGSLYLIWDDGTLARFDARWPDPAPPTITRLTPRESRITGLDLPKTIGAQVFDAESGIDLASLQMTLDGVKVNADYDPYTGYLTHVVGAGESFATLEPGWHTMTVSVRDQRGNTATKEWRFMAVPGGESFEQPTTPFAPVPGAPPYAPLPSRPPAPAPTPGVIQ